MAKTSKGIILNSQSQLQSDLQFALIDIDDTNSTKLIESVDQNLVFIDAVSKQTNWIKSSLDQLGLAPGCYLISDLRDQTDINVTNLINGFSPIRQYGYQVGIIADINKLSNLDDLINNQVYLINSGNSNQNQNALLQNNEIDDYSGRLSKGMSVTWQRDYTNVDVSVDHAGFVGMGQDTLLKGGNAFGYSTNGRDFNAVITPKGLIFRRPDAERMWRLLKPNEIADINSTVGDKVKKEVDSATAEIPATVSAANSAVSAAGSAVAASKVNSDAIVAQSEAISEAKTAMDSATAEIQQTAANAASDAAKIRADVAQVQNEVDTAKAASSASVEALKSDVSAAKQDIQAAQQANENVAKQLDTYTEQAQAQGKTIKDIQDAQDGYTATIADIKGNVSKISDTVDGLSASLKDDQTDVATLKAQADQLSATLTDHDKSIAQLTASAKELSSTLEDADGRLSKVEQTASTLTNEFSDQQGQLNRVEQTATGTQQTVANQQGQINSIQTDVSGIHETLTGQGNQIATINTTLNGLDTKYEGASGDLNNLKSQTQWVTVTGAFDANQYTKTARIFYQDTNAQNTPSPGWFYLIVDAPRADRITQTLAQDNTTNTWTRVYNGSWQAWTKGATNLDVTALSNQITTNSTQITQNKQAIALKADQSTVDNLSGEVSQNTAQLKVQADQISSKVSSEDFNTLDSKVGGAITQIDKNTTAIDQANKQISLKADQTEVDTVKGTASQNSSRLNTMANEISSKVTSTDVNNIVDSKGYATTSTVQSLITQKAGTINENITSLDAKYSAKDGINLQRGTGDCSFPIGTYNATVAIENYDDRTKMFHAKESSGFYTSYNADASFVPTVGETYTVSADVKGSGTTGGDYFKYEGADSCSLGTVTLTNNWQRISNTVHIGSVSGQWIFYLNNNAGDFYVKHIKIERGSVATPWTPAPSDNATVTQVQQITASIDGVQSTVANKADESQVTQLSNLVQSKVSASDFTSKVSQLSNDINARVTKGDLISQINLEAGNTLIQSGKIYLDANTIVFGENSRAIIPSAAIGNIDAGKITTGSISVPMSDGNGKATVKVEDGKVIITGIGPGADQVNSSPTPFDPDYIGQSDITIDHEGLSFDATVDIWNGHPGTNKALGVFRPTSLDTADTAGVSYIVKNFPSDDGPQNAGDYFAIDRQGLGEYQYIHGVVYKASEDHGSVHLGTHFYDPVYIHPYGAETGIRSTWCSWSSMGNRKFPALVNSDHGWSGIAFPMQGPSFIFDNNGYVARPNQKIGNYNGYGGGNQGWYDPTDPNQAGQTIDYSKWA